MVSVFPPPPVFPVGTLFALTACSNTDLILARLTFVDGVFATKEILFRSNYVKDLDLVIEKELYYELITGVIEEIIDSELTEETFQKYIKYFVNDFYFRKED